MATIEEFIAEVRANWARLAPALRIAILIALLFALALGIQTCNFRLPPPSGGGGPVPDPTGEIALGNPGKAPSSGAACTPVDPIQVRCTWTTRQGGRQELMLSIPRLNLGAPPPDGEVIRQRCINERQMARVNCIAPYVWEDPAIEGKFCYFAVLWDDHYRSDGLTCEVVSR